MVTLADRREIPADGRNQASAQTGGILRHSGSCCSSACASLQDPELVAIAADDLDADRQIAGKADRNRQRRMGGHRDP
jgi:hypothetical protein